MNSREDLSVFVREFKRSIAYPYGADLAYFIFIDSTVDGLTPLGGRISFVMASQWAKSLLATFPYNDFFLATRVSYEDKRDVEWNFEPLRNIL